MLYIGTRNQRREVSDILDDLDMDIWKVENGQSKKELEQLENRKESIEKVVQRGFGLIKLS